MRLRDLPGLGAKSEQQLQAVGIHNADDLRNIGAVRAFVRLTQNSSTKPSLNFLYAMVGALENRHWTDISAQEKVRLIREVEGYLELEKQLPQ